MNEPQTTMAPLKTPKHEFLRFPVIALGAEHLVMGQLMRRNILAYKAPPNNEGYNLLCIHPDPRTDTGKIRVQVKSRFATDFFGGYDTTFPDGSGFSSRPNIFGGEDTTTPKGTIESRPDIFGGKGYRLPSGERIESEGRDARGLQGEGTHRSVYRVTVMPGRFPRSTSRD
jgi:hypothetical protein